MCIFIILQKIREGEIYLKAEETKKTTHHHHHIELSDEDDVSSNDDVSTSSSDVSSDDVIYENETESDEEEQSEDEDDEIRIGLGEALKQVCKGTIRPGGLIIAAILKYKHRVYILPIFENIV